MDNQQFQAFLIQITNWVVNAIPNLVAALLILAAGYFIASRLSDLVRMIMAARPHIDQTLTPVVAAIVRYLVLIITFVAVLGQLGVQIASMLAVLGAAGLAIGLALQGTLSNIAAGLMLLWLRPFRAGESIEAAGISGSVVEVGLFATHLRTGDGLYHFVPNSDLWNTPIRNMSRNPTRRLQIDLSIGYDDDIARARSVLLALAANDSRVLRDPAPKAVVTRLTDGSVGLALAAWSKASDHGDVQSDLMENAQMSLAAAGLSLSRPQRIVQMVTSQPTESAGGSV